MLRRCRLLALANSLVRFEGWPLPPKRSTRLRRGMMRKHALANPSRPVVPAELPLEKSWRSVAEGDLENS